MTDICYVLSHGFAARMVLHSTIVPELRRRGVGVTVVAPNAGERYFQRFCASRDVTLEQAPAVHGLGLKLYGPARRYLFDDYEHNAALRAKHLHELHSEAVRPLLKLRPLLGKAVNRVALRWPLLPRLAQRVEQRLLRSREVRAILQRLRPRLLVSTYPVNWLEALFVLEAQQLGIPTVGQLLSWDNISCKGRFAALPDRFIAWGPVMSDELRSYYGVAPERISECGVAHFDAHFDPTNRAHAREVLASLGLCPDDPYLFFGMSARFFCPHELDVVEWLAARVQAGAFGPRMQLVVRPHPQNIRGSMADGETLQRLQGLVGGRVALDLPQVVSDQLPWDLEERDLRKLAALIAGCAVSLNSGSTLSIDAVVQDRPVVLPIFDAGHQLPWWRSVRRVVEFPHLQKMLSFGGVAVVRSFAELEQQLGRYLADQALDAEGRARLRAAECGPCDGQAAARVAEALALGLSLVGSEAS
ncbi:MAG: hypothetical protein IPL40_06650 [Proteobacteria bacterium]|nr:hypothetical protein [Pseudomonadota bacterium]